MKTFSFKNTPKDKIEVLNDQQLKQIKAGNNSPVSHDLMSTIGGHYSGGDPPP